MISPKIFALSLLLISPLALARVHFTTTIEMTHPSTQNTRTITAEAELENHASVVFHTSDDLLIEAQLLDERDKVAVVRYTVLVKNEQDVYEKMAEPVLHAAYDDIATLKIGQTIGDVEQNDLTLTVKATKL
jgi:hypothetical protein